MNRHIKLLITLLCMVCVFSLATLAVTAEINAENNEPERTVTGLEIIVTNACKTQYAAGETFKPNGYIGKVYYSDGYATHISSSRLTVVETGPLTADMTQITFEYEGFTAVVPITVSGSVEPPEAHTVAIEATLLQTDFLALEHIDPAMLSVNLVKSDASKTPLDLSQCVCYPALDSALESSITSLLITYSEGGATYSASVSIKVAPILSLEISGLENAKLYESLPFTAPAGLTVTAYYDEFKTVSRVISEADYDVISDSEFIKPDQNGKTTLTFTADTASADAEISVLPIVNYSVTGIKGVYYYGDKFNKSDVFVYAIYSDMYTANVTDQVIFDAPETIIAGSKIVAVHNGYDLKEFIKPELPEGKLVVITEPAKLKYEIGETFDSSGLTVAIEYTNGEKRLLNASEYSITVSNPLTAADRVAIIGYYGAGTNISISVGDEAYITRLEIIGAPSVMTYYEGNLLNTSGLIIKAYLSDGTNTIVDHRTLTFTPSLTTPLTKDITSVIISANDGTDKYCRTELPITVNEKRPLALVAISQPNKLTYTEGERFDPDGLVLSLFFNDGTTLPIESTIRFSPEYGTVLLLKSSSPETMLIHAIYDYQGKEYSCAIEITVTPAEIENLVVSRNPLKSFYEVGEEFDPTGIELLLIYKDLTLVPQRIPLEYLDYSPKIIAADTKEIIFTYRGLAVVFEIDVNAEITTPDIPGTTDPTVTTTPPPETSEVTTAPPPPETSEDITTSVDPTEPESTPEVPPQSGEPTDTGTNAGDETTGENPNDGSSMLLVWIIVIVIIIAALVALIIYYVKNFT